jgi:hypothetical protein
MTALPPILDLTSAPNSTAAKAYFAAVSAYLAGLLGTDGVQATALAALGVPYSGYAAPTAATTLTAGDRGKIIDASGTFTVTLPAASTLPAGWFIIARNMSGGLITIAPPDSATIDGKANLPIGTGRTAFIVYTGSAWITDQINNRPIFKQACRLFATSNINLTTGGLVTCDGIVPGEGFRVLCTLQTNPAENGVYIASAGPWTRAPDCDDSIEMGGAVVAIERGSGIYQGTMWQTNWSRGAALGTDPMPWYRIMDTRQVLAPANGGTGKTSLPLSLGALRGYSSTVTAAGTTTLTAASTELQVFTGTTTQTVVLPTASTVVPGFGFMFVNKSTGALTIKAFDGSTVATIAAGATLRCICNTTTGGTSAAWTTY